MPNRPPKNKLVPPPEDMEDQPDPEDPQARAELAFDRSATYEFGGKRLTFAWDHQAATARLGIRLVPGDVADFLYLLTLPGDDVVLLRGPQSIANFFRESAAWARELGMDIGDDQHTAAIELATRILTDHEASKVKVLPRKKQPGEKTEPVPKN